MTPRRVQTMQALLDAAARLFAERGYHETGVPDIVRAAGVSQGTFYQYFTHRRDVLMALTQVAHAATAARPPIRSADFGDVLRAEIRWYLFESQRFTSLAKIWHDAATYDQEIAALMRAARSARATEFSTVIKSLETASDLDADVAATAIVAMIEEFTYRWIVEGDGHTRSSAELDAAAETVCRLVLRSLGASSSS